MTCLREGMVSLPDGRRLGYAEYGVRGGTPLLYFHGVPGGRQYDLRADALRAAGAWMFTLERPGVGLSDVQPGRRLLDWPDDVGAFADTMGIDRFAVIGTSGGGPYALACGAALAERVTIVGLQCALLAPFAEPGELHDVWRERVSDYRTDPTAAESADQEMVDGRSALWASSPLALFTEMFGDDIAPDDPGYEEFRAKWLRILAAHYGNGAHADEYRILATPFGFDAADVAVPVRAWHGDADDSAPIAAVRRAVAALPDAALTEWPGEGHFLGPAHHPAMLEVLAGARR